MANGGGGGVQLSGTGSDATNSTIVNNSVSSDAGAGTSYSFGGGVVVSAANFGIVDATIVGNRLSGGGSSTNIVGGGIYMGGGATTLEASILAQNKVVGAGATGPNCVGTLTSGGYNLLGTASGCAFGAVGSDMLNKQPRVGKLANNGGPTRTLALDVKSVAVDAIPRGACPMKKDQRGVKRPQNKRCDIGAFELEP
jgi:hypothetical protein